MSLGPDRTQRLKQVKNRLNGNVYNFVHKKRSIPPPTTEPPRSHNGRFIPINTVVNSHSLTPHPILINGQWMVPLDGPFPSQSVSLRPVTYSIPTSTPHYDRNSSSNPIDLRSPSLPPRISNESPFELAHGDNFDDFMEERNRDDPNTFDDFEF